MKTEPPFRSLRLRLLAPMIVVAMLAALLVAATSYHLGNRRSNEILESRFKEIETSLSDSSFPLNSTVLNLLADLTQTELIGFDEDNMPRYSTIDLNALSSQPHSNSSGSEPATHFIQSGEQRFRVFSFPTVGGASRSDKVAKVAVMFNENQIDASRRRAALLPLATGLSTIAALSSITLLLTSRLVNRLAKLQHRVERVADGDFETTVNDDRGDEIGRLAQSVNSMARQLDELWQRIHRQQSEKLLHQIAGGMAHQLRNSLTGARMAIDLHAADCDRGNDESIRVAVHQMEHSEDHVRRLLMVASGRQDEDRPMDVLTCFNDIQNSLSPIAKHLQVDVDWKICLPESTITIQDGPSWVAAVTNLIDNAIQAASQITVTLSMSGEQAVQVQVVDNGPGIDETIAAGIFDPFVTSKPEGMGLGLSVVKRASERLQGDARWYRLDDQTVFEFEATISPPRKTP